MKALLTVLSITVSFNYALGTPTKKLTFKCTDSKRVSFKIAGSTDSLRITEIKHEGKITSGNFVKKTKFILTAKDLESQAAEFSKFYKNNPDAGEFSPPTYTILTGHNVRTKELPREGRMIVRSDDYTPVYVDASFPMATKGGWLETTTRLACN
jgi:hypothetical protein